MYGNARKEREIKPEGGRGGPSFLFRFRGQENVW